MLLFDSSKTEEHHSCERGDGWGTVNELQPKAEVACQDDSEVLISPNFFCAQEMEKFESTYSNKSENLHNDAL
jgi:hypothetical protein